MKVLTPRAVVFASVVCGFGSMCLADVLFNNGPFVTNPTGGTGAIAGQPISQAEPFPENAAGSIGFAATVATDTAAADNFVVPAGGWDLDSVVLFAYQSGQTTPTITAVHINLWTAPPYSAESPAPLPDPLPTPVLATALVVPVSGGEFVAHRNSSTQTASNRPVFAYTVSLNGLPNGGVLPAGEYWLEWSFVGASSPSANVFMPIVTPRAQAFDTNARLRNLLVSGGPRVWFESREGFITGVSEGRPYALPFILNGTALGASCPADLDNGSGTGTPDGGVDINDLLYFLFEFEAGSAGADLDNDGDPSVGTPDGGVDVNDLLFFLARFEAGC